MNKKNQYYQAISLNPGDRIFFIGIGGISMSGLAELANASGFVVAGSDMHTGARTDHLKLKGVKIFDGHLADRIDSFNPDLVVYTAAVQSDNPELIRAAEKGIITVDRAGFLGWINRSFRQIINIAGTHGKTTTTAMCSLILIASEQDPTVHLGAELIQFETTVRVGKPGDLMVSEACEYKNSFLKFFSTTAAVLNIDYDHVDCFKNLDNLIDVFTDFVSQVPSDGYIVLPTADKNIEKMTKNLINNFAETNCRLPRIIWFGAQEDTNYFVKYKPDFYYNNLIFSEGLPQFDVYYRGNFYGRFKLQIPGRHNVDNAMAAIACAHLHGADPAAAVKALAEFQGAEGRFTFTGHYRQAKVIADYAHHPAAAAATLEAAANIPHKHIWVVFQPLTFSRTEILFDDYVKVLKDCEYVLFAEIFSDREKRRDYISSRDIAKAINNLGGNAVFCDSFADIKSKLDKVVSEGDLILVLGPEDIRSFADQLTGRKDFMQRGK